MERFRDKLPGLLGEPGQPGYRIAILAQDENPVQALQQMLPEERQLLAQGIDGARPAQVLMG